MEIEESFCRTECFACFVNKLSGSYLILYVSVKSLQHALTSVLIRQVGLNLETASKCTQPGGYFCDILPTLTYTFVLIFIVHTNCCNLPLLLVNFSRWLFLLSGSAKPNHSVSPRWNSLCFICIPIDHPVLWNTSFITNTHFWLA